MSDPTGAITDIDGDGRISGYESADYASRHTSNERLRKYFSARASGLYAKSIGDVQGVWAATFQIYNMGMGAPFPSGRASRSSSPSQVPTGDNTPIGDCPLARVLLGWSIEDWSTSGTDAIPVLARTMFGMPFSPSLWLTAGGVALTTFGGMVFLAGTGLGCTGLGLPVGTGVAFGGAIIMATGAGLTACGLTGIQVETGLDIVPWYER
ncbi:MAG: hypothetical protein WBI91_02415 [Coriobacteriia bacterium]